MRNRVEYLSYVFTDVKISKGSLGQECSLPISSIGIDTLEIEVKCQDPSIINFVQNTPITYFHQSRQMGIFYVQSITRIGPDRYTIYGISSVGRLDQRQHYGGIYTGETVEEIVSDICGNIPFVIKSSLAKTKLYGWLPIRSARENLAQVLFAAGANLSTDYNGVIHIETLWQGTSGSIPADRIYQGGRVEYATPITTVTVLEHQYVPTTDESDLFEGTTTEGQVITFNEPMHDLVAVGFTILESNANYARVSAGSGILSGKQYIHTSREISAAVNSSPIENVKRIEDATLVSLVNSSAVTKRLAEYYGCNQTLDIGTVVDNERAGQVIQVFHPYEEKMVEACIASMDVSLSATLKSKTKALVGFLPTKPNAGYYDAVQVITENTNWVVPEGVTEVRIVLISGGTGGFSGVNGKDATLGIKSTDSSKVSNKTDYYALTSIGMSGLGGDAGEGGIGGRIFQASFKVTPGQTFPITIGQGGLGGQPGTESSSGSEGGATTFGSYTSANGSSNPAGFLESVSGITYAGTGPTGVAGGRGSGLTTSGDSKTYQDGPPITIDGVDYHPGASSKKVTSKSGGTNYNTGYGTYTAYSEDGYGGGAAYKANGSPGLSDGYASVYTGSAYGKGGSGGKGADALPPDPATIPGSGGNGGNGGGGGGGGGRGQAVNNFGNNASTRASLNAYPGAIGKGGLGSVGGTGAPGCAIIYYSRPKESSFGAFMDKTKKFIVDREGRIMVA